MFHWDYENISINFISVCLAQGWTKSWKFWKCWLLFLEFSRLGLCKYSYRLRKMLDFQHNLVFYRNIFKRKKRMRQTSKMSDCSFNQPSVAKWIQTNQLLHPFIRRGKNCMCQSRMSCSPTASLCLFSPSFVPLGRWPSPSFMRVWASVCVWKNRLTAYPRVRAFRRLDVGSQGVWQMNTRTQQNVSMQFPCKRVTSLRAICPTQTWMYHISFSHIGWWAHEPCLMFHS